MKVLIACEESQRVCEEFRRLGHEAYSSDIIECGGGHPEWHIQGDCMEVINGKCVFETQDGKRHVILDKWDLIVAHPPCTYLSNVATRHHSATFTNKRKIADRTTKRIEAMDFFMKIVNADCDRIAIENPVGIMNTAFRKPDQIIEPWYFSSGKEDTENYVTKRTCLWLKGLPPLYYDITGIEKPDNVALFGRHEGSGKARTWEAVVCGTDRGKERSKTFRGIAKAIAEQWGGKR